LADGNDRVRVHGVEVIGAFREFICAVHLDIQRGLSETALRMGLGGGFGKELQQEERHSDQADGRAL